MRFDSSPRAISLKHPLSHYSIQHVQGKVRSPRKAHKPFLQEKQFTTNDVREGLKNLGLALSETQVKRLKEMSGKLALESLVEISAQVKKGEKTIEKKVYQSPRVRESAQTNSESRKRLAENERPAGRQYGHGFSAANDRAARQKVQNLRNDSAGFQILINSVKKELNDNQRTIDKKDNKSLLEAPQSIRKDVGNSPSVVPADECLGSSVKLSHNSRKKQIDALLEGTKAKNETQENEKDRILTGLQTEKHKSTIVDSKVHKKQNDREREGVIKDYWTPFQKIQRYVDILGKKRKSVRQSYLDLQKKSNTNFDSKVKIDNIIRSMKEYGENLTSKDLKIFLKNVGVMSDSVSFNQFQSLLSSQNFHPNLRLNSQEYEFLRRKTVERGPIPVTKPIKRPVAVATLLQPECVSTSVSQMDYIRSAMGQGLRRKQVYSPKNAVSFIFHPEEDNSQNSVPTGKGRCSDIKSARLALGKRICSLICNEEPKNLTEETSTVALSMNVHPIKTSDVPPAVAGIVSGSEKTSRRAKTNTSQHTSSIFENLNYP